MGHPSFDELEAGVEAILQAPADEGTLEMIVRRPRSGEREALEAGVLDPAQGLVGDVWFARTGGREAYLDTQLNVMSARVIALVAGSRDRWALAGDQLFVDLNLSTANLPAGTQLAIGSAVIEVTDEPHTACRKFASRFGAEATEFVNSPRGRTLRLRGLNARVVRPGTIRAGDLVRKITQ